MSPSIWLVENHSSVQWICCRWTLCPNINFQPIRTCYTYAHIRRMTIGHVSFLWTSIALHSVIQFQPYPLWPVSNQQIRVPYILACLYVRTGRAIAVTMASALASSLLRILKFLVKVFKSLYLLNHWMDLLGTLPDVRYWSEVLCCTIMTHIGELEVVTA